MVRSERSAAGTVEQAATPVISTASPASSPRYSRPSSSRGGPGVGLDPPAVHQLVALEGGQDGVGVSDVDAEQHGVSLASGDLRAADRARCRGSATSGSARRPRGSRRRSRRTRPATARVSPPVASSSARSPTAATTSRSRAGDMLSHSRKSRPAATASTASATVVTSTWTGTSGKASRTRWYAAATPPAASLWLSLTIATSYRPIRLLVPPPARTAYFSRIRRPGVVLRVSSTMAPVPASASAQARVWVATPDSRQSRFSAVRSAVSSARVGPVTVASTSPRATRSPSWTSAVDERSAVPPPARSNTAAATASPATTPSARATRSPSRVWSAGMVATAGHVEPVRPAGPRPARWPRSADRAGSSPAARRPSTVDCSIARSGSPSRSAGSQLSSAAGRPIPASRWPSHSSSAVGKSSRQWQPRVSSRRRAPRRPAPMATVTRLVASQAAGPRRGPVARRARSASPAVAASDSALRSTPAPRVIARCSGARISAGTTQPGRRPAPVGRVGLGRQVGGDVGGDPAGEDQPLEQRVGGEPVGAVHAGAGGLAAGVQAGDRRAAAAGRSGRRRWRSARPGRPGSGRSTGSMPAARQDADDGREPGGQKSRAGAGRRGRRGRCRWPASPGGWPWPRRRAAPARPVRAGRP